MKASRAQRLLRRAWAATQAEGVPVKPWPWADTWPIARLSMPDRGIRPDRPRRRERALDGVRPGSGRGHRAARHLGQHGPERAPRHPVPLPRGASPPATSFASRTRAARGTTTRSETRSSSAREAVEILWDTDNSLLTLVTCYPFDALVPGSPLRYVVRAAALPVAHTAAAAGATRAQQLARGDPPASGPAPARSPTPRAEKRRFRDQNPREPGREVAARRSSRRVPSDPADYPVRYSAGTTEECLDSAELREECLATGDVPLFCT